MVLDNKIVIYQTADGQTTVDVKLEHDTVWLSANQMATLFNRDEKTIRKHINNVFSENELEKEINTHFLRVDGVKQLVAFYSLDVIISVGYRVKSQRGTQFRIWANRVLKARYAISYLGKQGSKRIFTKRLCRQQGFDGATLYGTKAVGGCLGQDGQSTRNINFR